MSEATRKLFSVEDEKEEDAKTVSESMRTPPTPILDQAMTPGQQVTLDVEGLVLLTVERSAPATPQPLKRLTIATDPSCHALSNTNVPEEIRQYMASECEQMEVLTDGSKCAA